MPSGLGHGVVDPLGLALLQEGSLLLCLTRDIATVVDADFIVR